MNDFSFVIGANIKRFRALLETSINQTTRQTIQTLLDEELAKAAALPTRE
jgi:hypothetical protein